MDKPYCVSKEENKIMFRQTVCILEALLLKWVKKQSKQSYQMLIRLCLKVQSFDDETLVSGK